MNEVDGRFKASVGGVGTEAARCVRQGKAVHGLGLGGAWNSSTRSAGVAGSGS